MSASQLTGDTARRLRYARDLAELCAVRQGSALTVDRTFG